MLLAPSSSSFPVTCHRETLCVLKNEDWAYQLRSPEKRYSSSSRHLLLPFLSIFQKKWRGRQFQMWWCGKTNNLRSWECAKNLLITSSSIFLNIVVILAIRRVALILILPPIHHSNSIGLHALWFGLFCTQSWPQPPAGCAIAHTSKHTCHFTAILRGMQASSWWPGTVTYGGSSRVDARR